MSYIYIFIIIFKFFEYRMTVKTNIFNTMPINKRLCNTKTNIKPTF